MSDFSQTPDRLKIPETLERLTDYHREAIVNVEEKGNGAYIWAIHHFIKLGLMGLTPEPKLQNIRVYRLNDFGKTIRDIVRENHRGGSVR